MSIFIVIALVLFYSVGMGATYKAIKNYHYQACETAFFGPLFWPVALGVWGGILLTSTIGSPSDRAESRRRREIEEAEHRVYMAKLQAQESAELDRMLNR